MLHDSYGTFLARHLKDYEGALFHLKRAYLLAQDDWHKKRLMRLIKTVEGLNGDKPKASAAIALRE